MISLTSTFLCFLAFCTVFVLIVLLSKIWKMIVFSLLNRLIDFFYHRITTDKNRPGKTNVCCQFISDFEGRVKIFAHWIIIIFFKFARTQATLLIFQRCSRTIYKRFHGWASWKPIGKPFEMSCCRSSIKVLECATCILWVETSLTRRANGS